MNAGGKKDNDAKLQLEIEQLRKVSHWRVKLQRLPDTENFQDSEQDNHTKEDEDMALKLVQRYLSIKGTKFMPWNNSDSGNTRSSLASKINFEKMLKEVATEGSFEATYFNLEEMSAAGEHQCLVQLDTVPVVVCYGCGSTPGKARSLASWNALEYLKVMTKD